MKTLAEDRALQGMFRPLVVAVWVAHCRSNGIDPKDKEARDAWYAAELCIATGRASTK